VKERTGRKRAQRESEEEEKRALRSEEALGRRSERVVVFLSTPKTPLLFSLLFSSSPPCCHREKERERERETHTQRTEN